MGNKHPDCCDVCLSTNVVVTTKLEATGRRNDSWPYIWFCLNCGAYVGCHVGTYEPLGHLAHDTRRYLRKKAHAVFDQIWMNGLMSRDRCYQWLGEQLSVDTPVHIGILTTAQLARTVSICREFLSLKSKKVEKERRKKMQAYDGSANGMQYNPESGVEKIAPIDPISEAGRAAITQKISEAMDAHVIRANNEQFRSHLGMSLIGAPCDRFLWYHFRWFAGEEHSARELRLFNVGHRAEPIIRAELRAIGVVFLDSVDVDGRQITVSSLGGHYGGSCDGVFTAPRYGLYEPTLLEIKTSKTGSEFSGLAKNRMPKGKPQHYIQNSCYGRALNIRYCLYICENKNDSDRYVELVELDFKLAEEHEKRALNIIQTTFPPERISEKPEFYVCKMCSMSKICHGNAAPIPNCRNCANAIPSDEGQWYCGQFSQTIPKEFWAKGCPHHKPLAR